MARGDEPRLNRVSSRWALIGVPAISVMLGSMTVLLPSIALYPLLPPFGLLMLLAWRMLVRDLWPVWAALPLADFGTSNWDSTAVIGVAVNLEGSGVEPAAGAACAVLARPPASTTAMTAVVTANGRMDEVCRATCFLRADEPRGGDPEAPAGPQRHPRARYTCGPGRDIARNDYEPT